eukprot:3621701-Rhodomonas_salina.4
MHFTPITFSTRGSIHTLPRTRYEEKNMKKLERLRAGKSRRESRRVLRVEEHCHVYSGVAVSQ